MELQRKRKVGNYSDKVRYLNKVRTYRGAMFTGNKGWLTVVEKYQVRLER